MIEPTPRQQLARAERDRLGESFDRWCQLLGLPQFEREFRFSADRAYRLDRALPHITFGVELHGATWTHGRHTRGAGFAEDRRKMNEAIRLGWHVVEFTSADLEHGEGIRWLATWLPERLRGG